ncbi:MAG: hypothetical protein GY895_18120, partial [Phycisphaera sp.]|nr:hypothetical protein [Phycisphaera sp.]
MDHPRRKPTVVLLGAGLILTSLTAATFAAGDEPCDLDAVVNPVTFPPTGS